jgi:hypothetical protein
MKKLITSGLMLLSLNAFSQSYLILGNGVTLTTDTAGFVFDFGHFSFPAKVTIKGGQFLVEDKKLATIDSAGFLYEKDVEVEKIKGKGLNYLINDDYHLMTIDSKGFIFDYKEDKKVFKKAIGFGGNFFTVKLDDSKSQVDLYTINDKGNYFKINVPGLNPADIVNFGGMFFQTRSGVTYTVSKAGFVFSKSDVKVKGIKKAGGNYLIDLANVFYTVSEDGLLIPRLLPPSLVVSEIQKLGANYVIDSSGRLFIVDKSGNISERSINHDLNNTKVLSL